MERLEKVIQNLKQSQASLEKEKDVLQNALQTCQLAVDTTLANLEKAQSFLRAFDEEAQSLKQQESVCESALTDLEVEFRRLDAVHSRASARKTEISRWIHNVKKEHPWIEDEKDRLRDASSEYHLSPEQYSQNNQRLRQLENVLKDLKRRVNLKVNSMIDRYLFHFMHRGGDVC